MSRVKGQTLIVPLQVSRTFSSPKRGMSTRMANTAIKATCRLAWVMVEYLKHKVANQGMYRKPRKCHLRLIVTISTNEANPSKLKASKMLTLVTI